MKHGGEEGAVFLMVLVGLASLAVLAGLVLRLSESNLAGLAAERAAFRRDDLVQSALATLGARLPADDFAQDGTPFSLPLPGGSITLRVYSSQGLINPNFTRASVILSSLIALGATTTEAERLTIAIVNQRSGKGELAFRSIAQVAALFRYDANLWPKVAPYLTLLGRSDTIDLVHAPLALRGIIVPQTAAEVNSSAAGQAGSVGFYEIWLHVDDPVLDAINHSGQLWIHVSALAGRDRRLHIVWMDWPAEHEG